MLKTRVIPCLLLKNSGLVKTVNFDNAKYIGDPINAVKIFNEKEVDEIIFLDITATAEKRKPSFDFLSRIASEAFMPFSYGGGIDNVEDMKKIFNLGVEKISINTAAVLNLELIKEAVKIFGSQSIIVSIDVKKNDKGIYEVFINNGKEPTGIDPVEFSVKMERMGVGEIFLNSIDKDGTMSGYDIDIIEKISKVVNIPVIVCGGAGKIEDFSDAIKAGASAVSAGSLFVFYGKNQSVLISYPEMEKLENILN